MEEFLQSAEAQVVVWVSVLLIICAFAVYIVGRFRGRADDDRLSANELLTNFQELHEQGDIADEEFREIKTVLGTKLKRELKDTDE